MDLFLNFAKCAAMAVGGMFGLLGTLKEYSRDQRGRRWQVLTIIGIGTTTLLAIGIQNLEYIQSIQDKKNTRQREEDTAKWEANAASTLTSLTSRSEAISKLQGTIANDNLRTVSALAAVLDPVDPIAVSFKVVLPLSQELSLKAYASRVKAMATAANAQATAAGQPGTSAWREQLHALVSPGTTLGVNQNGKDIVSITIDGTRDSPWLPNQQNEELASALMRVPSVILSFYKARPLRISQRLLIYSFDFAGAQTENWTVDAFAPYRKHLVATIDYPRDVLEFEGTALGVMLDESSGFVRSVAQLPGSIMQMSFWAPSANFHWKGALQDFQVRWGHNYASSSSFNTNEFKAVSDGTYAINFEHECKAKDFGLQ